ncbi:ABC transporter substrate-binding protein [Ramlibacter sp. 2FC]|uniref:ABC transporter substrate-binding protein n=1 Tax=Ramlibacter sp. 2FC TaxID=2502188 RepID=UPI0010F989BB|nr:ABC transporter substrate-binding protein [Ramlibacter sp. 2FC]
MTASRFARRATVAAVLGLALASAGANTLTWSSSLDALSMDPHSTNNTFTNAFVNNVYEGLVRFNEKLQVEPALATSWKTLSPTVWRFTLRQGVKFHGGESFDADDVVFSWKRTNTPGSLIKGNLSDIKEVRKVDAYTVDIETHQPLPILPNELQQLLIMDKGWSELNRATEASDLQKQKENHANRNANGTGPFRLESRDVDTRTVMVANASWWDKPRHNLRRVVFTPIKSDATRTSSLISGGIDASINVPLQDVQRLQGSGNLQVVQGPELRTIFLGMDQQRDELLYSDVKGKNPFKDLRVRKAVYHAIDIEAIKRSVMRGASWPAGTLLSPHLNGAPAALNKRLLSYDPEAAKKLLAEAGYPNGFAVGLQCPNDRYVYDEAMCIAMSSMLAKVGIKAQLMIEPTVKWSVRLNTNDVSLYVVGHAGLPMADSYGLLKDIVHSRTAKEGSLNAGRYSNPKFDAMLPQVAAEIDPAKRNKLIEEAVAIERNDVSHVPLHQQPITWAAKKGVSLAQAPDNQLRLWLVTVPEVK